MSVRIRYLNHGGLLTSTKTVVCGLHNVQVVLNTEFLSFSLTDVDSGEVLGVGTAKTVPALKIAAKLELVKMGAIFLDEVRRGSEASNEETVGLSADSHVD